MKSRLGIILTTAAVLGSAAFLIAAADAQQGPATAPQPPASDTQLTPQPGANPHDFVGGNGQRDGGRGGMMRHFSAQDRAAFFDAHIAAVKAGLQLTPDQEKLWGPVEQAVRDMAKERLDQRQKAAQEGRPADPVERLQRAADAATARGATLHKLADAARPLWASLSDDQKRRLPVLMHGMRGENGMQARNGMYHQNGMQPQTGMQPQNGWQQRMRGMMQRQSAPGGDDDRNGQ